MIYNVDTLPYMNLVPNVLPTAYKHKTKAIRRGKLH